ncbi:ethylbenzene dehydrogenase-related protein [Haloarchaeobius sp. HRN-SO-5]|uniref:ethylbenzene dehydrogenase-related protein n=1 Tax=Haloarchaeobius sp. HRN-SO-5 TaxID=3446118 RepID=UPI003EC15234
MTSDDLVLVGALAVVVLAATAVVPAFVDARPAYEIPVNYEVDGETLERVDGEEWGEAPAATIPVSSAGADVPAAENTTVEQVTVEAVRTDDRLYLRLTWADPSRDVSNDEIRTFTDAVAVQLPVNATARPPIAMGSPDNLVNVWYWAADDRTEELLAGGAGTTTEYSDPTVRTNATYENDRWKVVFSRPLEGSTANRTTVPTDEDMDVAFAVWNGGNMERSGQKAASEWYYLALGPGPAGPPYELILWTVAGVAIVVTTLVTIEGVRRTRGG